jgi:hypothetical protein
MTSQNLLSITAIAAVLLTTSCQQNTTTQETTNTDSTAAAANTAPIVMEEVMNSEEFPDAQLSMGNTTTSMSGDSVKVIFNFNVKNYDLKGQTSDSVKGICSNSDKGQHIHFILDNSPYAALYEPKHDVTIAKNTEHYLLAFLSRSYHMSLKNKNAAVLYHFKVDENGKLQKLDVPNTPMVFYSRPKGDYLGNDTKNVLLDFYVWNTTLGGSNKVKANINSGGRDTSIMITEWKPYFLKNLAMGKNSITLTMLDNSGNKVAGDNTEVTREFNLAEGEPMR